MGCSIRCNHLHLSGNSSNAKGIHLILCLQIVLDPNNWDLDPVSQFYPNYYVFTVNATTSPRYYISFPAVNGVPNTLYVHVLTSADADTSSPYSDLVSFSTETTPGACVAPTVTVSYASLDQGNPWAGGPENVTFNINLKQVRFDGNSDEAIVYTILMAPPNQGFSTLFTGTGLSYWYNAIIPQPGVYYSFAVYASNSDGAGPQSPAFNALVSAPPTSPALSVTGYTFNVNKGSSCAVIMGTTNDFKSPVLYWRQEIGDSTLTVGYNGNVYNFSMCNQVTGAHVTLYAAAQNAIDWSPTSNITIVYYPPPYAWLWFQLLFPNQPTLSSIRGKTSLSINVNFMFLIQRLVGTQCQTMQISYSSDNKATWQPLFTADPGPFLNFSDANSGALHSLKTVPLQLGQSYYFKALLGNAGGSAEYDVMLYNDGGTKFTTSIFPAQLLGNTVSGAIVQNNDGLSADVALYFPLLNPDYPLANGGLTYPKPKA